jgi:hypothetical protein
MNRTELEPLGPAIVAQVSQKLGAALTFNTVLFTDIAYVCALDGLGRHVAIVVSDLVAGRPLVRSVFRQVDSREAFACHENGAVSRNAKQLAWWNGRAGPWRIEPEQAAAA